MIKVLLIKERQDDSEDWDARFSRTLWVVGNADEYSCTNLTTSYSLFDPKSFISNNIVLKEKVNVT